MTNTAATIKPGVVVTTEDGARHVVIGLGTATMGGPSYAPHVLKRAGFHLQNLSTGTLSTEDRRDLTVAGHFTDGAEGLLPRAKARSGKAA